MFVCNTHIIKHIPFTLDYHKQYDNPVNYMIILIPLEYRKYFIMYARLSDIFKNYLPQPPPHHPLTINIGIIAYSL